MPIAGRRAAQGREQIPQRQRRGNHAASVGFVGEVGKRDPKHRVKQREGKPGDRSELSVAKVQVGLDRLGEDAEYLAVEEIENVGEEKQRENQLAAPFGVAHASLLSSPISRSTSCSSW